MKARVLERPAPVESRPLRVRDVPTPAPSDDELLVKTATEPPALLFVLDAR
jgi:NADPH:quinone reductase-like Zn-dependent oxidoreductase